MPSPPTPSDPPPAPAEAGARQARSNARLAIICGVVFASMVGVAFAAVPFYQAFCQATGFNGTVRRATVAPTTVSTRTVTVAFDTNVRGLDWSFEPNVPSQQTHPGESKLAFFKVTNNSDQSLTGRAVYNVNPGSAGYYFSKLECFCFKNQTLAPHQTAEFPVVYFVDPRFGLDDDTRGINQITLSYTFFPAKPLATSAGQGYSTPGGAAPRAPAG
ncbi:MAG TPA: cytochrome c oxidase assembly protein [Caulobacteraceae bacterium]|jgi:cytochrome c oxidase assembly protein subunit 11|nr:cytochrome c oxidase assembly protein [Caulobacteraceae bacterium]